MRFTPSSITRTAAALVCGTAFTLSAADSSHGDGHKGIYLTTPLHTQNPLPKKKVKLAYYNLDIDEGTTQKDKDKLKLELEYKFNKNFGVNLQVPYTWVEKTKKGKTTDYDNLDDVELSLNFANYAFEDNGVVIGYGLGLGIPTGDEEKYAGSDHLWRIMPFVNVGKAYDKVEVIAHVNLVLNANENGTNVEDAIEYDLSLLYKLHDNVKALVEFNGDSLLDGDDHTVIDISPGLKYVSDDHWEVAVGASFPLTDDEHFEHEYTVQFLYFF